jgi:glycosyltransferase involved in cell wall biosynthesis
VSKVLFHTNSAHTFYHFRLPLMRAKQREGFEVVACGPRDAYADLIEAEGIRYVNVPMRLATMRPLTELRVIIRLARVYLQERPAIVHNFSLKSIAYGSLAARVARVPIVVNTVTGLGHAFSAHGILRRVTTALLRVSCRGRTWMTFQNPDDMRLFQRLGIAVPARSTLIRGSGVGTERFRPLPQVKAPSPVTFLLVGRMMWAKGVREYCEAARLLRAEADRGELPKARFLLLGGALPGNPTGVAEEWLANPDSVPPQWIAEQAAAGYVEYRPHDDDVLPHLQEADVVVLPSYYPEGLPRSLLEAMSCGKAVITTDTPGCRDLVEPGVNGVLVPPRDVAALAGAMREFLRYSKAVPRMGDASRRMVMERFSDGVVIDHYLQAYRQAGLAFGATCAAPVSARRPGVC